MFGNEQLDHLSKQRQALGVPFQSSHWSSFEREWINWKWNDIRLGAGIVIYVVHHCQLDWLSSGPSTLDFNSPIIASDTISSSFRLLNDMGEGGVDAATEGGSVASGIIWLEHQQRITKTAHTTELAQWRSDGNMPSIWQYFGSRWYRLILAEVNAVKIVRGTIEIVLFDDSIQCIQYLNRINMVLVYWHRQPQQMVLEGIQLRTADIKIFLLRFLLRLLMRWGVGLLCFSFFGYRRAGLKCFCEQTVDYRSQTWTKIPCRDPCSPTTFVLSGSHFGQW